VHLVAGRVGTATEVVPAFEFRQRVMHGPVVVVVLPGEEVDLLGQQPADLAPALGGNHPRLLDGGIVELDRDVSLHAAPGHVSYV
jgi:hypothetical protein